MMPPTPPDQGAQTTDPGSMGADPAPGGEAVPDQAMMLALRQMMGADEGPGSSTDPRAVLEALTRMAASDRQQLQMIQQIEGAELADAQKQAMIQALQAMIQQLSQDAHVPAGPDAAASAPDTMGPPASPAIQEIMPQGVSRMSGEPVPDELDIPPGY